MQFRFLESQCHTSFYFLVCSTSGCQFGESCHFLHYVPGGLKAVTQMLGNNPALPVATRNSMAMPSFPDASSPTGVKTRLCTKYNTAEGCKFGDKCHLHMVSGNLAGQQFLLMRTLVEWGMRLGLVDLSQVKPGLEQLQALVHLPQLR